MSNHPSQNRALYHRFLAVSLLLSFYLHFVALGAIPGWYSDEGTLLEIARHLAEGKVQYLGLTQSFLLAGRMPLFPGLLAVLIKIFGTNIIVLRALAGVLSSIAVFLLGKLIWQMSRDAWWAFASMLAYLLVPQLAFYQRLGFSYHLGAVLLLGSAQALWLYLERKGSRWLYLAAFGAGLAVLSDIAGVFFILPMLIAGALQRQWRETIVALGIAVLPAGIYLAALQWTIPQALQFDLAFILHRVSGSLGAQIIVLLANAATMGVIYAWWHLMWLGYLLIPCTRCTLFFGLFWGLPWLMTARSVALPDLGFYYQILTFPLIAAGIGGALRYGLPMAESKIRAMIQDGLSRFGGNHLPERRISVWGTAAVLTLLLAPLFLQAYTSLSLSFFTLQNTENAFFVPAADAEAAITYVNQRTSSNDLIIASPALAWAIHGHVTDFQLSLAFAHQPTAHFPTDIPPERFAYNLQYNHAKYAVIDPVWLAWYAKDFPAIRQMTREIQSRWHLEQQIGTIAIYRNLEDR